MSYGPFQSYIPILILFVVLTLLAGSMLLLSYLFGTRPSGAGQSVATEGDVECGMETAGDTRQHLSVKFYLCAMLFVLFAVVIIFLFSWAVIFHELRMFGFLEMLLFILLVFPGFVYLWRRGVLDWSESDTED
jgi:NADH-quinone oxidoreductase subunit A